MQRINSSPLFKALLDCDMNFSDVMAAYDITIYLANLSNRLNGYVYADPSGAYLVVVNKNFNVKTQQKIFLHEMVHIAIDLPDTSYIIGLDMQYTEVELRADKIAENVYKKQEEIWGGIY